MFGKSCCDLDCLWQYLRDTYLGGCFPEQLTERGVEKPSRRVGGTFWWQTVYSEVWGKLWPLPDYLDSCWWGHPPSHGLHSLLPSEPSLFSLLMTTEDHGLSRNSPVLQGQTGQLRSLGLRGYSGEQVAIIGLLKLTSVSQSNEPFYYKNHSNRTLVNTGSICLELFGELNSRIMDVFASSKCELKIIPLTQKQAKRRWLKMRKLGQKVVISLISPHWAVQLGWVPRSIA